MSSKIRHALCAGLAGTAMCTAASAQSSVTVSGQVRVAATHGNGGQSSLYGAGGNKGWAVNDVLSNLNFSGKEDLGGGLYAGFHIQHFFQADTGAPSNFSSAPNAFWDGRALVRLGGEMGEVYAGRDYAPIAFTGFGADPWGWDGSAAQVGAVEWANYWATSGIRTSNTVGYKSPALGGVTAQLAVSAGEGAAEGRDLGGNVSYAANGLWISASGDGHKNVNRRDDDHLFMLAAAYDFGVLRPGVMVAGSKVAGRSYSSVVASLTAPIGSGLLKAAAGRISDWTPATTTHEPLVKASLGYQYDLSKRTHVFGAVASAKADKSSRTTAFELGLGHAF